MVNIKNKQLNWFIIRILMIKLGFEKIMISTKTRCINKIFFAY